MIKKEDIAVNINVAGQINAGNGQGGVTPIPFYTINDLPTLGFVARLGLELVGFAEELRSGEKTVADLLAVYDSSVGEYQAYLDSLKDDEAPPTNSVSTEAPEELTTETDGQ